MPLHIRDATGTLREISEIHVRDSAGTLREIQEGWVRDAGGTLRQFHVNVQILVSGFLGTSEHTNAATVTVGFRFKADSFYQLYQGGTAGLNQAWINNINFCNDYEMQCSYTGTAALKAAAADGTTWYSLGSTVSFVKSTSPGIFGSGTYSWIIRDKATQTTQATGTVGVVTEDGS